MKAHIVLQYLLKNINETEYKRSLRIFDLIHKTAMQQIKHICPEISQAEKRLALNGMKEFRDNILSARKDNDENLVYRFYLMEYNVWLADSELCTALDFSPEHSLWDMKNNLSINISELLDFIEYFENKQHCTINIPTEILTDIKRDQ